MNKWGTKHFGHCKLIKLISLLFSFESKTAFSNFFWKMMKSFLISLNYLSWSFLSFFLSFLESLRIRMHFLLLWPEFFAKEKASWAEPTQTAHTKLAAGGPYMVLPFELIQGLIKTMWYQGKCALWLKKSPFDNNVNTYCIWLGVKGWGGCCFHHYVSFEPPYKDFIIFDNSKDLSKLMEVHLSICLFFFLLFDQNYHYFKWFSPKISLFEFSYLKNTELASQEEKNCFDKHQVLQMLVKMVDIWVLITNWTLNTSHKV